MKQNVILLNGPSSSGKSTLSIALQKALEYETREKYGIISIDNFLDMTIDEGIYEDDVFEISPKLCKSAVDMVSSQKNIIIDHVITSKRIFKQLIKALEFCDIYLISVTCPLQELIRREQQRKNRCLSSAEASFQYLFPQKTYDLTIDTFQTPIEECMLQIIKVLQNEPNAVYVVKNKIKAED
ncbi:AAA family ATPase [Clostridium sp.]|uniref:phosphotransferase-like protein n=1 Tax=Clostridium sp. TaxID=1506 RepID=UPI003216DD78